MKNIDLDQLIDKRPSEEQEPLDDISDLDDADLLTVALPLPAQEQLLNKALNALQALLEQSVIDAYVVLDREGEEGKYASVLCKKSSVKEFRKIFKLEQVPNIGMRKSLYPSFAKKGDNIAHSYFGITVK